MSDFEIRDDMPLPPYNGGRQARQYPLGELKVGQYIKVEWKQKSFLAKKVRDFLAANPGWEYEGRALEEKKSYGFWCMKRSDTPADSTPKRANERRMSSTDVKTASAIAPTAHQQKLREAAKLQPAGKTRQHSAR